MVWERNVVGFQQWRQPNKVHKVFDKRQLASVSITVWECGQAGTRSNNDDVDPIMVKRGNFFLSCENIRGHGALIWCDTAVHVTARPLISNHLALPFKL